jgi:hypothetical protein
LAPFWSPIRWFQRTDDCGDIFHRQIDDNETLNLISHDSNQLTSSLSFTPSWSYIVTWYHVCPLNQPNIKSNSFQIVITTDGKYLFSIFNYGFLSWFVKNSFAGYNVGDGVNYFYRPESFSEEILKLSNSSNIGIPDRWIYTGKME